MLSKIIRDLDIPWEALGPLPITSEMVGTIALYLLATMIGKFSRIVCLPMSAVIVKTSGSKLCSIIRWYESHASVLLPRRWAIVIRILKAYLAWIDRLGSMCLSGSPYLDRMTKYSAKAFAFTTSYDLLPCFVHLKIGRRYSFASNSMDETICIFSINEAEIGSSSHLIRFSFIVLCLTGEGSEMIVVAGVKSWQRWKSAESWECCLGSWVGCNLQCETFRQRSECQLGLGH